jgi:hypothetical protein
VRLFVQGRNRWRDEDGWPLARARTRRLHLHGGGRLGFEPPTSGEEPATYVYDPLDPCPTLGGNILLPATYVKGPVDQQVILDRSDVLAYTSDPLPEDVEVTGPVSAVLYAATSAPDTDWVVKLCVVRSDGRTFNVCDGILRASYRKSLSSRALVKPGSVERYEIELTPTSWLFEAGERLRILITSSDFPRYDRNPNTGDLGISSTRTVTAQQQVFADAERPSHMLLSVV